MHSPPRLRGNLSTPQATEHHVQVAATQCLGLLFGRESVYSDTSRLDSGSLGVQGQLNHRELERAMGIEPMSEAWEGVGKSGSFMPQLNAILK